MNKSKNKYRYEFKYLINYQEMYLARQRLSVIMERDEHTINGVYKIRSLYFDDYWNSAYNQKIIGINNRKKYRIRMYNDDDSFIRLEKKEKVGFSIYKKTAPLTKEETLDIIGGRYEFLLKKDNRLLNEFYYQCVSHVMRPCVIIEYEREPFVNPAGDTRITFDSNVRSSSIFTEFFNPLLPFAYVFDEGKLVMEVKYTEFLPKYIKDAIPCRSSEYSAVSKFTDGFEKVSNYIPISIIGESQI
ncbi:MAG: polyphosphate polymerase domain-containing protein [Oscillospiraceae bacterium]|nr:polyphosphate polymerase domain-containing protein [Oscillospiraceae bacterium]MDD4414199.1 polyphosphate polymerase domain-containing protein [Oscillospiraceae bacterium]